MVSNPTALVTKNDRILMVYKAVSKYGNPIMAPPENDRSVEDPYIWSEDGKYFALVKDFQGYFTKTNHRAIALFVSDNGIDWHCSENPLAFMPQLNYGDEIVNVHYLERPQIYIEKGTMFSYYVPVWSTKMPIRHLISESPLLI